MNEASNLVGSDTVLLWK